MGDPQRYDIRRQTTLDMTNALTSVRRMARVLREQPRHTNAGSLANSTEVAAENALTVAEQTIATARDALEALDTF